MEYVSLNITEKAKSHFREKLSNDPTEIVVPEWECSIFYKPMSLRTKGELNKYAENPFEYAARSLKARALDIDGAKIFKSTSITEIMREFDSRVVEDIVYKMVSSSEDFDDDDVSDDVVENAVKK